MLICPENSQKQRSQIILLAMDMPKQGLVSQQLQTRFIDDDGIVDVNVRDKTPRARLAA